MAKFKTRARAVDMLGRQQIADVSTAISELFKNAHDAYAERVEVDYFRSDELLVLRDDGIGMTRDEFENRWLVLGTESKLNSQAHTEAFRPKDKKVRAIMGEKGIGRLAIALLGDQVLVLTRANRKGSFSDLTVCFIHWGLFATPSVNLDDLDFPVKTIPDGRLPSFDEVSELIGENIEHVKLLSEVYPEVEYKPIIADMQDIQIDPVELNEFLGGISIDGDNSGTHFLIPRANREIRDEIERERESKNKEFSKCLLGFCNSTFCGESSAPIQVAFKYWQTDTSNEDLIAPAEFFTKEDLACADQYISGNVNEYGQFEGTVRVYDKEYPEHRITWGNGKGKPTQCGPFKVEFGYLQGEPRATQADPEDFARISTKLGLIGGLYVYRDDIRILPYGNSDIDWLDIEKRRNLGAGYYFFSYRRLYGAVCLTREFNGKLREKAGREGFQKDKAYRQLKDILENLFIQIAADFYRKDADFGEHFQLRKDELDRLDKARKKQDKQVGTKRKNFAKALESFFQQVSQSLPNAEVETLRSKVYARLDYAAKLENPDEAAEELMAAEGEAVQQIAEIRKGYQVVRPRGVGLTKQLEREWTAYQSEQERLEKEVFFPLSNEIAQKLGKMAEEARIYIDQRRRLKRLIKEVSDSKETAVKTEAGMLERSASDTRKVAVDTARNAIQEFRNVVKQVEKDFSEKDFTGISTEQAEDIRRMYEIRIEDVGQKNTQSLSRVREMLTGIAESLEQADEISHLDMIEAMDSELQELREQVDSDAELVQLGLAVAVINHEFEAAIKGIRSKLRDLGSWARANDDLVPLYQDIRTNFDHLDAHLNLFTPLQRRLQRKGIDIKGGQINHYLRTLFSVRFQRHDIELEVSQNFLDSVLHGYPSTVYPVFVNIIDNAVFWLSDLSGKRLIKLDFLDGNYRISNNGPSISSRDVEAIFEQGFSRKPNGRGLGLYISRKALRKEHWNLSVREIDSGVMFEIQSPIENG